MSNIQTNIEDKTFKSLIKRFTGKRDWNMVRTLFMSYGYVLEDREKAANK